MITAILSFINVIVFCVYGYFIGSVCFREKPKFSKRFIYSFLYFSILFYLIIFVFDPIYSIFFSCLSYVIFIKIIFKKNMYLTFFSSLIAYTGRNTFKLFFIFSSKRLREIVCDFDSYTVSKFCINIFSAICFMIFICFFKKALQKIVDYFSNFQYKGFVILGMFYLNVIFVIIFKFPYIKFGYKSTIDLILLISLTIIIFSKINYEYKTEVLKNHYKEIFDYSKANEMLLVNYRKQVHENRNRLLIIKSMLKDKSKNKSIEKYIDSLIDESKNTKNTWIGILNPIPIPGMKNFINYKLIKMQDLGAEIELIVSDDLANINISKMSITTYNDLYTILGVILDNIIDALRNENKKLVSIHVYIEDNKVCCEFANYFTGKIELEKLYVIGYTTKGEMRGIGLPLVNDITKRNKKITVEPKIIDNFFVQYVTVNLPKTTKK